MRQSPEKAGFARVTTRSVDWGKLAPLRFRARALAEGIYAGAHKSKRRGAGIEFGGFREYVTGDDLRFLDRRSLLVRERPLLRQFETETDRALRIVVDATSSMAYRGPKALGAKYAYAAVLAAALTRIAVMSGDPVGLSYLGGDLSPLSRVPVGAGRETFERVLGSLEHTLPDSDATTLPRMLDNGLEQIARAARSGTIVVLLTDALDLPADTPERLGAIASRGRVVLCVQLLDPDEAEFPFEDTTLFKSIEGDVRVESDAEVKPRYLQALAALQEQYRARLAAHGARWLSTRTDQDLVAVARQIIAAIR